eukprot:g4237.t1 g4237   contig15:618377-621451(-)
MLLEEALSGSNTSSSTAPLPPADAALALLSFLRDELPAGGIAAEKRFINLFPLIVDRAFGSLVLPPNSGNAVGGTKEVGGSSPSSPVAAAAAAAADVTASTVSTSVSPTELAKWSYRHDEGGWLGLQSQPSPPSSSSSQRRSSAVSSHLHPNRPPSLDSDPIIRLLRAPRRTTPNTNNAGVGVGFNNAPTLLDALSAESIHRPSVRFKFPLGGLMLDPLLEDWKVCFIAELSVGGVTNQGRGGFGGSGGGAFGTPGGNKQVMEKDEETTATPGVVGKENASRILYSLLSAGPEKQLELRPYYQMVNQQLQQQQQQQHNRHSSPFKSHTGFGGSPRSSPVMGSPLKQRQTPGMMMGSINANKTIEPLVELSMMEYYMLVFLRFPMANSSWQIQQHQQQTAGQRYSMQRSGPTYGQRMYSYLFSTYLSYYLPHGVVTTDYVPVGDGSSSGGSGTTTTSTEGLTASGLDRTSELFLRLVIEFWIQGYNVIPTTNDAVIRYRRVRNSADLNAGPSLRDALEMTQPSKVQFKPPTSQIQVGILSLVRHLVSDSAVRTMVQTASGNCQRQQKVETEGSSNAGRPSAEAVLASDGLVSKVAWCLPPAMTAIQSSVLNYIRLGLSCGAIHQQNSSFHRALETWLIWLEPWNYVMKRRVVTTNTGGGNNGNGSPSATNIAGEFLRNAAATVSSQRVEYFPAYNQPKPASPSTYSSQWEAYVVSNLYVYIVPLAIFLRRARELEFSSSSEYPRSLALVRRVLRVYSTPVVAVLNSILNKRSDAVTSALVGRHRENLGCFCPPTDWKLTSCQVDATNLLEEIFSQYQKRKANMDFFDRCEAKFDAIFSTGRMGSDEAALQTVLSQVQCLVNLPMDYQVLPDEPQPTRGFWLMRILGFGKAEVTGGSLAPERGPDGKLTDLGRQQINAGMRKCNAMDVHFIGDPMLARYKSYEVPVLVDLAISASNYLNEKLGLVVPDLADGADADDDALLKHYHEMERYNKIALRVNLRFLADSRNIIFISIALWLLRTVGGIFR